ncbi:MAG: hypothetical protein ABI867_17200 [Kofleriaceae bacterium]
MRWLVLVMFACGGPATPAVQAPPPPLAPDPDPGDREVGLALASAPTGDPIRVTVVPPVVGEKYRLEMTSTYRAQHTPTAAQLTEKAYTLDVEVLEVTAGIVTKLRATVVRSSEHTRLAKADDTKAVLAGTYLVTAPQVPPEQRFDVQVVATRGDGNPAGSWETEVLTDLLREELGRANTYRELARGHGLRLGEATQLEAIDKRVLIGADPKDDATALRVSAHANGTVTYQISLARDVAHLRLRVEFVVETATGRVRETRVISLVNEPGGAREDLRSVIRNTW